MSFWECRDVRAEHIGPRKAEWGANKKRVYDIRKWAATQKQVYSRRHVKRGEPISYWTDNLRNVLYIELSH